METQTRFDLNIAIANWRVELAAQSDLTAEVRRELETHLRDSIAELQRRGLNAEESFWLAQRRVGLPNQLAGEFIKADPTSVWRERVFWMATAALFVLLWNSSTGWIASILTNLIMNYQIASGHNFISSGVITPLIHILFRILPIAALVLLLVRGSSGFGARFFSFFRSRSRLTAAFGTWALLTSGIGVWLGLLNVRQLAHPPGSIISYHVWENFIYSVSFPLVLLALIFWLMPPHLQAKPKIAS